MPSLSILVPAYNEAATLASVMQTLATACPDAQIVYINDGSKDGSLDIMKAHARAQDLVIDKENGGKGSAIREGLAKATGTYTVIQDADLEYDPTEIRLLEQKAMENPGAAVFGSRFLKENPRIYSRFLLGNKVMTFILNALFGSRLTDSYTCYKLLPTDAFRSLNLKSNGFELEAEICCMTLKKGIRILEIPITYRPRTIEQGKKIRFGDAVKGAWTILKLRLSPRA